MTRAAGSDWAVTSAYEGLEGDSGVVEAVSLGRLDWDWLGDGWGGVWVGEVVLSGSGLDGERVGDWL